MTAWEEDVFCLHWGFHPELYSKQKVQTMLNSVFSIGCLCFEDIIRGGYLANLTSQLIRGWYLANLTSLLEAGIWPI